MALGVIKSRTAEKPGPANILNDLDYKTWLQFQKSFERYDFSADGFPVDFSQIAQQYISFFTKRTTERGASRILTNIMHLEGSDGREVTSIKGNPFESTWRTQASIPSQTFDYVILNVDRPSVASKTNASATLDFVSTHLRPHAYSTLFCRDTDGPYPYVWSFANSGRANLQLCDEKLLLDRQSVERPVYALQFRKDKEELTFKEFRHIIHTDQKRVPQYVIPRPPARKKEEFKHPAKFPEELVKEFIGMFTSENDWVFDIMAGTGSALVAACQMRRNSVGIELNREFYDLAKKRIDRVNPSQRLPGFERQYETKMILGDAREAKDLFAQWKGKLRYCITSPPYWSVLHNKGSEGQRARRKKGLRLTYSEDKLDLGNIADYDEFVSQLVTIFGKVSSVLSSDGYLTVIVKNVKRNGVMYSLAWDLVDQLAGPEGAYNFLGYTLWCQDDVGLKPFAIGHHWVSNILHQYCLHFSRRTIA